MSLFVFVLHSAVATALLASLIAIAAGNVGELVLFNVDIIIYASLGLFCVMALFLLGYAASKGVSFCAWYLASILNAFFLCGLIFPFTAEDFVIWSPFAINVGIILGAATKQVYTNFSLQRFLRTSPRRLLPRYIQDLGQDIPLEDMAPQRTHGA